MTTSLARVHVPSGQWWMPLRTKPSGIRRGSRATRPDHGNTEQPSRLSRTQFSRCFSPASHATDAISRTAQTMSADILTTDYQKGCAMNNTTFTASTAATMASASSHEPTTAAALFSFLMGRH
jgi:hypothetical protein